MHENLICEISMLFHKYIICVQFFIPVKLHNNFFVYDQG